MSSTSLTINQSGQATPKLSIDVASLQKPIDAEKRDSELGAVPTPDPEPEDRYLTGRKLFLVFVGFLTSVFLIALDQSIVATALPKLISEFNALTQVTWIISGYFLTQAGLMLTYSQLLTLVPTKWVYLGAIAIFEIGSIICGAAPTVEVLIFGRAFAGVGASGIFVAVLSIIAEVTRIEQRPVLFGSFGAVFAVASVAGPLLGGAFADYVTWRWSFYINAPFGVLAIGAVLFFLKARPPIDTQHVGKTFWQRMKVVDWVGSVITLLMVVTLLLPLQWGGNERAWNDRVVIALLVVFGVTVPIFVAWEWYMGDRALMPLHMLRARTQTAAMIEAFMNMFNILLGTYYLPFFYQAARSRTATESGIDILPFMLSVVVASGISGGVINFTGRYWYWLVGGPLISSVAGGLLYTITPDTSSATLIGFQILFGAGIGFALQNTIIAIQAHYNSRPTLIPQGTSFVTFFQLIGGVIGIAIAGTVFANQLQANLATYAPDLPQEVVFMVRQSVLVIQTLPEGQKQAVIQAYVKALSQVFLIAVPTSALASFSGIFIENLNLKNLPGGAPVGGMHA